LKKRGPGRGGVLPLPSVDQPPETKDGREERERGEKVARPATSSRGLTPDRKKKTQID